MRLTNICYAGRFVGWVLGFLIGSGCLQKGWAETRPEVEPPPDLEAYRKATLEAVGDPARGRKLLDDSGRTRCLLCHAIEGRGGKLGPDLLGVGGRLTRAELLDSILQPSAKLHPDYIATIVSTKAGQVLQGLLKPISETEVELATSETETIRLQTAEIDERKPSPVSTMPAGLHEKLKAGEMADLLSALSDLKLVNNAAKNQAIDPREIPRAIIPLQFVPLFDRSEAFHRPVWFGPVPGLPGVNAVVEMDRARIWLLQPEGVSPRRTLFADLGSETTPGELTGLTSIAFHPDFEHNRRYFLKMHTPKNAGKLAVQIVERKASADGLRDSGEPSKPILLIPIFSEIHNGGHLAFGPDGFLYIGMGDTGPQGDPRGHAQDLGLFLGKILRIDIDRQEKGKAYAIPPTNPFRDHPGALPELWAIGFREPWRFSFDTKTGDLWVGDVGQDQFEEVAIVREGENHGWNVFEGLRHHSDRFALKAEAYVPPIYAYSHRVGPSVTGGFVYRGKAHPKLDGLYIFGDFETRRVWALDQQDRQLRSIIEVGLAPERIASFGSDAEGELYFVGLDRGMLYRIDPTEADFRPVEAAREVVPTSRSAGVLWKSTTERPEESWTASDFDDSAWKSSEGGFGTRGTPNAVVRTDWKTSEIWLRREFTLKKGFDSKAWNLAIHHDEDAEVYLNGVLAARLPGFVRDYEDVPIRPEALKTLHEGTNLLAVHCRQVNGGQYIDLGISELQANPR